MAHAHVPSSACVRPPPDNRAPVELRGSGAAPLPRLSLHFLGVSRSPSKFVLGASSSRDHPMRPRSRAVRTIGRPKEGFLPWTRSEGASSSAAPGRAMASSGPARERSPGALDTSFGLPGVPGAVQSMMGGLLRRIEEAVGEELLASTTPEDVRGFGTPAGSVGSVTVYKGKEGAKVDRVLVSWLLCRIPGGAVLALATVIALMSPATDTPHLLLEVTFTAAQAPATEGSEKGEAQGDGRPAEVAEPAFVKMVAVLDLMPRLDLVQHPEYLKRVYDGSGMSDAWKEVKGSPSLIKYESPTPYIRATISPCALSFSTSAASTEGLFETLGPLADEVVSAWVKCVEEHGVAVDDALRATMKERDIAMFEYGFVDDLTRNLPRMFGEETTGKVIAAFRSP